MRMRDATPFVSTTNACKLCRPLGAAIAFKGIEGCVPFLHGSQGCATYMRRYIISHFREPVDIASSSLGEKQAVYGGGPNLKKGILNVTRKYGAQVVGVATTCLTETIGDDVNMILSQFRKEFADLKLPEIVAVSTPSYGGTHIEGFHGAVRATVVQMAQGGERHQGVNILPGFVSPADLRHIKEICADFGLETTILPDYSETLDGPILEDYERIPSGGTPVRAIQAMGKAAVTLEFGRTMHKTQSAGAYLESAHNVVLRNLGMPVGLRESDQLFQTLEALTGRETPPVHRMERGRLVDALVDGHKYVAGKRAIVYGDEDLVVGLTSFLAEIGIRPVLVASGGRSGRLRSCIAAVTGDILPEPPELMEGVDFHQIAARAGELAPDLVVGNSKGYRVIARELGIPLVRVGFPVHDRVGAQRILHLGYRGAQTLYDHIVNALLEAKQSGSDVGYGYM
jgi:nitrogenase molybdenum-iron protein NifN